jgi:hypothetical protein
VRLGTASLAAAGPGGPFIAAERLDLRKYAARPHLARVLCDYILYVVSGRLKKCIVFRSSHLGVPCMLMRLAMLAEMES